MINWFGSKKLKQENEDLKQELSSVKNEIKLSDIEGMSEILGISSSISGYSVSSSSSMKVSVVFACVRLIAGAIAQMPVHVYSENGGSRARKKNIESHLLSVEPSPLFSAATFWEYVTAKMLLNGDGYAVILRDKNGRPEELLPINPDDIDTDKKNGRLNYYVTIENEIYGFDQDDMLHFPGFGFDGEKSLSVIQWGAKNAIGLEIAMEDYSGEFFKNGAHQSVAIHKEGKWDSKDKEDFRQSYVKTYGGVGNKKYPLVLDKTVKIQELSISPGDSQLLESREFQITDIARAFGVASFLVNQEQKTTSFGSGVGEISLSFLRYTISPHQNRFEQEINRKLFKRGNSFAEFQTGGLLRTTTKDRYEAYGKALGGSQVPGFMSQNEVRKMENLPPIDDPLYEKPYHPAQLISGTNENENPPAE